MAQGNVSYNQVFAELGSIGKNMRKNKTKAMEQSAEELRQILTTAKMENMDSMSPSARVAEAEILHAQAVLYKMQGMKLAEAQTYLTLSQLWFEIECERRDANFPTMDDVLSKAVLSGAIACGILLTQRPPLSSSPANPRLGLSPIPLPASKYITKCWSICYQLGSRLYTDFGCLEMAADYFELASQIVCAKPHTAQYPPQNRGGGSPVPGGVPSSGASVTGQSVSGRTTTAQSAAASNRGGTGTTNSSTQFSTPVGSRNNRTFATAMERQSSSIVGSSAGPNTEAGSVPRHRVPSRSGGTQGEEDRSGGEGGGEGEDASTATSNFNPASTFLVSGHFSLYLASMHRAIIISSVLKDYPRARSLTDDVLHHWRCIQSVRRGDTESGWDTEANRAEALAELTGALLPTTNPSENTLGAASSGIFEQSSFVADVVAPRASGATPPPPLSASTLPTTADAEGPTCREGDSGTESSSQPTTSGATGAPPTDRASNVGGINVPPRGQGLENSSVANGGGGGAGTAGSPGAGGGLSRNLLSPLNPTQLLTAMIQEEEVIIHVHLVRFFIPLLLKESPVMAQRTLQELQDLCQLYRELESKSPGWNGGKNTGSAGWQRQQQMSSRTTTIGQLKANTGVHSPASVPATRVRQNLAFGCTHTGGNKQMGRSFGGVGATSSSSRFGSHGKTKSDGAAHGALAIDGSQPINNGGGAAHKITTVPFSQSLEQLTLTLEVLLDAYSHFPTSSCPGEYEEVLESATEDFNRLMSATSHVLRRGTAGANKSAPSEGNANGDSKSTSNSSTVVVVTGVAHRCRELNILCCRVKEQIVSIPYDLASASSPEE